MIVVMDVHASQEQIEKLNDELQGMGLQTQMIRGVKKIVIGAMGDTPPSDLTALQFLPGVEKIIPIMKPYKLASREAQNEQTVIRIKDVSIGDGTLLIMAGPCAVENDKEGVQDG